MTVFTFGADPEIFVTKRGKGISAHGMVEGTKSSPKKVECGAIQVDGMALEFNIDPSGQHDFNTFNNNIIKVLAQLKAEAKKVDPNINFKIAPVMDFDEDYLSSQPDEAKELGCDPDYNAYTLEQNPRPDGEVPFRTGSGHLHVGWGADIPVDNQDHIEICANFIKSLDTMVGLFMTYIDREPRRRELYGKAGAFRPKPYGVEYRTPSNVWLSHKDYRKCIHFLMNQAIQITRTGGRHAFGYGRDVPDPENIRNIIDTGDYKAAFVLMDQKLRNNWDTERPWARIKERVGKIYGND